MTDAIEQYPQERGLVSTASGAFIFHDGKALMIKHRKSGWWMLAGGRGEQGEPPKITCRREADEELGARVKVGRLLTFAFLTDKAELFPGAAKQSRAYPCHCLTFHAEIDPAAEIRIAENEVIEWAWWDLDEVTTTPGLMDPFNAFNVQRAAAVLLSGGEMEYIEW